MQSLIVLLLACVLISSDAGSINRRKRGYLSRTGFCPDAGANYYKKDARLNFYGIPVTLPGDEHVGCDESECIDDSHCDGAMKCCTNYCTAKVCTPSVRSTHPCEGFSCPAGQVCQLHYVKCVMPDCPDVPSLNRPVCIPAHGHVKGKDPKTLGDHQPDTTSDLVQSAAALHNDATAQQNAATQTAAAPDPAAMQNDVMQAPAIEPAMSSDPLNGAGLQQASDALSYTDQQQFPQPGSVDTQAYAAPVDTTSMNSALPMDANSMNPVEAASMSPIPMDPTGMNLTPGAQTVQYAPDQAQELAPLSS